MIVGAIENPTADFESAENDGQQPESLNTYSDNPVFRRPTSKPDNCHAVYLAFVLAGTGFLLPYNCFITAVDYYHSRFEHSRIIFDMSLVYLCVSLIGVVVINCLVQVFSIQVRISLGYILCIITIALIALLDVWYNVFDKQSAYSVTLLAVAVIALGGIAQQSSFYGYASMLPPRYTQAVMVGESTAGIITSLNRMITKAMVSNIRMNTMIFFITSLIVLLTSFFVFHVTIRSKYVTYFLTIVKDATRAEDTQKITTDSQAEDVEVVHSLSADPMSYGILTTQSSSPDINRQRHEPQHDQYHEIPPSSSSVTSNMSNISFRGVHSRPYFLNIGAAIKDGLKKRYEASIILWPYMFSICMAYFVTLCLFPGIESEMVSCVLGTWMPIVVMAVFNAGDFIGKLLSGKRRDWSKSGLMVCSSLRLIFIPLIMLCATPRGNPVIKSEVWAIIFSVGLGLSNGYFGSVPMILAPSRVGLRFKEITGNMMMMSYSVGLTVGSVTSYLLDDFRGPEPLRPPCNPHNVTTTTLTTISLGKL